GPDVTRVAAWVRASHARPVLTVLTATDPVALGELATLPTITLTPLNEHAVADVVRLYSPDADPAGVIAASATAGGIPRQLHAEAAEGVTADVSRRLDRAVADTAEPHRQLTSLRQDIVATMLDLGHVRAATHALQSTGRDVVPCPYKGLAPFEAADADL